VTLDSHSPTVRVILDSQTLLKFSLATAGFVFLALYGARSPRTVGVLLTFPVLNGIALLNNPDPFRVAEAVYPLVMFNCLLFWVAVSTIRWIPPSGNLFSGLLLLVVRVGGWGITWLFFAYQLTYFRDRIPTSVLLVAYGISASGVMLYSWRRLPAPDERVRSTSWLTWLVRISLFALVFFCILYVSQSTHDQKWTGMASALPLPGLFALAALSVTSGKEQLVPIQDTVLLGPFLVVPFNWAFAHVATSLPSGTTGTIIGIAALMLAWVIALFLIFRLLPVLENYLDARCR
jgi:hypothetical protein